jgi:hypothetical protein
MTISAGQGSRVMGSRRGVARRSSGEVGRPITVFAAVLARRCYSLATAATYSEQEGTALTGPFKV